MESAKNSGPIEGWNSYSIKLQRCYELAQAK